MQNNKNNIRVIDNFGPYIFSGNKFSSMVWHIIFSLLPALILFFLIFVFGFNFRFFDGRPLFFFDGSFDFLPLINFVIIMFFTFGLEYILGFYFIRYKNSFTDGTAFLIGLLIYFSLPYYAPWFVALFAALFAMVVGRYAFGGTGSYLFHPVALAVVFVDITFPKVFLDLKDNFLLSFDNIFDSNFLYRIFGSPLFFVADFVWIFIFLGGIFILFRGYFSLIVPLVFNLVFISLTFLSFADYSWDGLYFTFYKLFSSNIFLFSFYVATDWTINPLGLFGKFIFAFGLGLLSFFIICYAGYINGVAYSVILMNCLSPFFDNVYLVRKNYSAFYSQRSGL